MAISPTSVAFAEPLIPTWASLGGPSEEAVEETAFSLSPTSGAAGITKPQSGADDLEVPLRGSPVRRQPTEASAWGNLPPEAAWRAMLRSLSSPGDFQLNAPKNESPAVVLPGPVPGSRELMPGRGSPPITPGGVAPPISLANKFADRLPKRAAPEGAAILRGLESASLAQSTELADQVDGDPGVELNRAKSSPDSDTDSMSAAQTAHPGATPLTLLSPTVARATLPHAAVATPPPSSPLQSLSYAPSPSSENGVPQPSFLTSLAEPIQNLELLQLPVTPPNPPMFQGVTQDPDPDLRAMLASALVMNATHPGWSAPRAIGEGRSVPAEILPAATFPNSIARLAAGSAAKLMPGLVPGMFQGAQSQAPQVQFNFNQINQFEVVPEFGEWPTDDGMILMSGEDFLQLSGLRPESFTVPDKVKPGTGVSRELIPDATAMPAGSVAPHPLASGTSGAERNASVPTPAFLVQSDDGNAPRGEQVASTLEPARLGANSRRPRSTLSGKAEAAGDLNLSVYGGMPGGAAPGANSTPRVSSTTPDIRAQITLGANARERLTSEALLQVSGGIQGMAAQGQGELRVRLNPEGLGELQIHVQSSGSNVRLKITASNERARSVLESSLNDLQESLSLQNIQLAAADVAVGWVRPALETAALPESTPGSAGQTLPQFSGGFDQSRQHAAFDRGSQGYRPPYEEGFRRGAQSALGALTSAPIPAASGAPSWSSHQAGSSHNRLDVLG